jgi:hypothetical protein
MMRNLIDMILTESTGTFVLDPALDPANYVMTDSLRGVSKWKAMTYVGNNGDEHIGQLIEVGYIMISKTSNRIIPISRDDEHNMGMDLLYDLAAGKYPYGKKSKKLAINPDDYLPIWPNGNNYIYGAKEIPDLLNALTKYLSYGGFDGMLKGTSQMTGTQMHLTDFVARKGNIQIEPGSLAPVGQKIISTFSTLAATIRSLGADPDPIKARKAFVAAATALKYIDSLSMDLDASDALLKATSKRIKAAQKANDIQELDEAFFGFHGIKNDIHIKLKTMVAQAKAGENMAQFYLGRAKGLWGDVDLAIDMLGRI